MANDNSTPYQADADVIQAARGIRRSPPQLAALMSPGRPRLCTTFGAGNAVEAAGGALTRRSRRG